MSDRTITGKILFHDGEPWANAKLTFTLLTDTAARPGEALPVWSKVYHTLSNGDLPAGVTLEVPPTGAFLYRLKVEENAPIDFYLQAGAALTIDEVVALGGQPGTDGTPEWAFVVQIYSDLQDADAGQVLTADGAGGASWEDASGGVEEAPDDGGLYGRQSEDWTALGSAALADSGDFDVSGAAAAAEAAAIAASLPRSSGFTSIAANHSLQAGDNGRIILCSAALTLTAANGLADGFQVVAVRTAAGAVTVDAAGTLRKLTAGTGLETVASVAVETAVTLTHLGSNVWLVVGDYS